MSHIADASIASGPPQIHGESNNSPLTTSNTRPLESHHDPLTSTTRPLESSTITVRIIKSFEYRTQKALVLKEINLKEMTVQGLIDRCMEEIKTRPGFKPYKTLKLG